MPAPQRPRPPPGARSWVLLVLDSCRYDSFVRADPPHLGALGPVERRWSYATWTAPSHYNLLMGLLPHPAPERTWSHEVYAAEYARYTDRLGVPVDLSRLAPRLWLPATLRELGWMTGARVSMPVLNETTPLAVGFDHYDLHPRHDDLAGMIERLRFYDDRPSFWLLNAGETHYPYERPDRTYPPLPRLSGLNGTVRRLSDDPHEAPAFFDADTLAMLHERQVDAVRYVDGLIPTLRDLCPDGTWLTVTADHGETFGEDGTFGHGPIHHPKVLEVPLVEGLLR